MTEKQMEDLQKFVQSARILRYNPPCAITEFMTIYGIEELGESELAEEALKLSEWLTAN